MSSAPGRQTEGASGSAVTGAPLPSAVLLVEDHFWTRYTAAEFLRALGYQVLEAQDAAEAIRVLSSGTHVDIVFSDIIMPGMDGIAFARWVAENHRTLPVLLTSGAPVSASAIGETLLRRYIAKPYQLYEVDRLIRTML